MPELNDFERGHILYGWDGSDFIPILVGPDGDLYIIAKGTDSGGVLRALRVDTDGQLIMVPRGASGNYMLVDAEGYLTMIVKGDAGGGSLETVAVDSDGQLIMVPRGASGNYLGVDSDGYMTTVIKGSYLGDLKTLAVDEDGKLNAFIYDTEDAWGQISTVGLSELAARLGSPVLYERSGQVYFMETWGKGAQRWELTTSGTGASIGVSPISCITDGYSLEMVGGSTFNFRGRATFKAGPMPVGRMGFQFAAAFPTSFDELELVAYLYTPTMAYSIFWRLDDANSNVDVYEKDTQWTKADDLVLAPRDAAVYNAVKLVVDLTTAKYVSLRVNAIEIDLSDWDVYSAAGSFDPRVEWQITFKSRSGQNDKTYLDNAIITAAEP